MLKLQEVSFAYHHAPFLQSLTLAFPKGKITALVGPNGCGKSTVLRLASGLLRPQNGRVELDGQDIIQMKPKALARQVSVLAQTNWIPDMPVEAFIRLGRSPHHTCWSRFSRRDRELVELAMKRTNTLCLRDKRLRALSGGERQRVYVAMALAQDTEMILLDEPTTYLDIGVQFELMELIRTLGQQEGKTVVMVLHDLGLALSYAEELVVMDGGRIVVCGTLRDTPELLLAMERVFGVHISTVTVDGQPRYICEPRPKSPLEQPSVPVAVPYPRSAPVLA